MCVYNYIKALLTPPCIFLHFSPAGNLPDIWNSIPVENQACELGFCVCVYMCVCVCVCVCVRACFLRKPCGVGISEKQNSITNFQKSSMSCLPGVYIVWGAIY